MYKQLIRRRKTISNSYFRYDFNIVNLTDVRNIINLVVIKIDIMNKIYFKHSIVLLVSMIFCYTNGISQSIANYASARNSAASYLSINLTGNAFNSWRNTTSFTQDDNRSDFTDIGFDFWYNGVRYTQFSVSTNGFLDFSSSTNDGGPAGGAFSYINSAFTSNTNPAIAPFYDDLTAQGGTSALGNSLKYVTTGSAPNRTLTIEWINMAVFGNTTPSLNFQVKLVETTGVIFVNYGTMNSGTFTFSYSMGLNGQTLSATPTATQLKELQLVNSNTFNNTVQNNLSAMPTANSQYVFTPPIPTPATGALSFTGVGQTSVAVNWPNWASNEVGYVVYNSTDNVNFNFVTQSAVNAVSANVLSLLPSTIYYWRVYAVTEGCLSSALTGSVSTLAAGSKTSIVTGLWNTATTWSPTGVPSASDNVTIANSHTVTIDANATCNNLSVGQGVSGVLNIGNNATARVITVKGNIIVNSGGAFKVNTASNITHSITIPGNLVNNGILNFATSVTSLCNASFTKNGNQTISGSGATTVFNKVSLNMGTSVNNILDIQTPSFVAPNNFLTLTNGTFKLSTSGASTIIPYTVAATIPQSGAIWLNSALSSISTQAALTMYGNITVSNGVFNVGNAADQDLLSNGGYLTINNGTLNIAGKYYATGINNLSKFTISGGNVVVPSIGSTNTTIAPFQIAGVGSQFTMSGGSLIIPREGGTGAQNLGFVNTGTSGGSVTGGTLQIGSSSSPAAQIIQINSSFSVGNVLVNSANVNASLLTNSLSVINNIAINSGTLASTNLDISLGGNWNNSGGTYVSGSETVTFLGTSAQTIFKTGGETFNNITFSNAGVKALLSAITASTCLINTGATLDVNTTNNQISLKGNFTNNGTFTSRSGTVLLNGTVAQIIGGTTISSFYNLTINNTAGAGLSTAENLLYTLTLSNGTFNTNGKIFTMISTASNTARIAPITGTGNILGNVTVQRYAPGGTTGWALLGAPISSALTYQDWNDNFPISCASCPNGSAGGFISIYTYDETAVGSYSDAASYIPMAGITDPITLNKGYWVYLGTGSVTTTPIILDVTGTVGKFNNTIPLTRTNTGSVADDGWNLISNPYPSPIKWSLLKGATANIDNAIYAYNADLNGGTGANASYVNGISSPAVGAGGIGDTIPMCQGFYVHSTGATALNGTESIKVGGNPTFLKTSNTAAVVTSPVPLFRLFLDNTYGHHDEMVVYLQAGATNQFDASYDAVKLMGQDPFAPNIRLMDGTNELQINGISPSLSSFSMPLKTTTGYNDNYTISLSDFSSFPLGSCITLFDSYTNTTTNLRNSNYVFALADTTTASRFTLNITMSPLNITSNLVQPTCSLPNIGAISAKGVSAGPWNYYWKDANGVIIKTSLNKSTADTITNLFGGNYNLEVNTIGLCDHNDSQFSINPIDIPVAQFSSIDTTYLSNNGAVNFTNTSVNAATSSWDFGDMSGTSTMTDPSYNYATVGVYTVSLITESSTGCLDTTRKNIVVVDNTSGIKNIQNTMGLLLKTFENNIFILNGTYTESEKVHILVHDVQGKNVYDFGFVNSNNIKLLIDLSSVNAGIYYLVVQGNKTKVVFKLPVK
jgi:hypothetical protein